MLNQQTSFDAIGRLLMPLIAQAGAGESTGPSVLDWGIVVVLIAAALFAVCRSGRRN